MRLVYKILTGAQWEAARREGRFEGSPVDLADGFIHLSDADQAAETARLHFAGQTGLWLLGLDVDKLGDALKWEPSRGGALFPHLYGPIAFDAIAERRPLGLGPDGVPVIDPASP